MWIYINVNDKDTHTHTHTHNRNKLSKFRKTKQLYEYVSLRSIHIHLVKLCYGPQWAGLEGCATSWAWLASAVTDSTLSSEETRMTDRVNT